MAVKTHWGLYRHTGGYTDRILTESLRERILEGCFNDIPKFENKFDNNVNGFSYDKFIKY
jgi:hypothetical protein